MCPTCAPLIVFHGIASREGAGECLSNFNCRHIFHSIIYYIHQLYINEVVLGTAFGVIMGPHVANVFDPRSWGSHSNAITLEVMRIVLATGLFAIGVELPEAYMAEHVKGLLVMVVPTMAFGWIVVAGTHLHASSSFT